MERIQTILMIVGAITSPWLLYKTIKWFPRFLGGFWEAGFRGVYPYDFMMNLQWIISEMKSRGYERSKVMDAGSDNPGVLMKNTTTGNKMEIRLHAPVMSERSGYRITVSNHENKTAIVMRDNMSEDNKRLLAKFLE